MFKFKRKFLRIVYLVIASILLLALAYTYQRSRFIKKANALFDPKEKAFTGTYLPWPIGRPTLIGEFDPKSYGRIRASLDYDNSGGISSNGMSLIIFSSDGHFFVRAN